MVGVIAFVVVVTSVIGFSVKRINSKASEMSRCEGQKDSEKNEVIVECIKKIKEQTSGSSVTITNVNVLYNEFEKISALTDEKILGLLGASSDEVLEEYLTKEVEKAFSISKGMQNNSELDKEDILKVEEEQYIRLNDTKKDKVAITKYGTKVMSESVDEAETNSRLNWIKTPVKWSETVDKQYGDRRFTHSIKVKIGPVTILHFWVRMGYNVSASGLKANYVDGDLEWLAESVMTFDVIEKKITDGNAKSVGENIDGHVRFQLKTIKIPNALRYQYNLVTTIKKWDKKKKTMKVEHFMQEWVDFKI